MVAVCAVFLALVQAKVIDIHLDLAESIFEFTGELHVMHIIRQPTALKDAELRDV